MKKAIYIVIVISLFSCRVAKKEWVQDNFTEKATINKSLIVQDSVFKSEILKIETSVSELETSVSNIETSSASEASNESTTVSGSIKAEDGKEKSVTIGNTTIKSNGANVSFETTSSKSLTKEFETKYQELNKILQSEKEFNQSLESELTSLKSEFSNFKSTYESEKTSKTKTVTKRGSTFSVWLMIILVLIGTAIFWWFRKRIPFL